MEREEPVCVRVCVTNKMCPELPRYMHSYLQTRNPLQSHEGENGLHTPAAWMGNWKPASLTTIPIGLLNDYEEGKSAYSLLGYKTES